jgi:uncharacterized protein (TIGR00251 family)
LTNQSNENPNNFVSVYVKPGSKKLSIVQVDENSFEMAITSKPQKGKANKEVIEELANYLNIKKTQLSIVKGHKSRQKVLQIIEK